MNRFRLPGMVALGVAAICAWAVGQEVTIKSGQTATIKTSGQIVRVTVNGEAVDFGAMPPRVVSRRVFVPLRGVFEKLGAYVEWRAEEQLVIATKGAKKVEVWIGKELAEIDDEQTKLDAPPMLVSGRTLVPLRFISEALGAEVVWDAPTTTVVIKGG